MFGKRKIPPLSTDSNNPLILGLIWSLKPSDASNLFAMETIPEKEDIHFGTTCESGHAIFWRKLVTLGLAHEVPGAITSMNADRLGITPEEYTERLKRSVAFSPTPEGKKLLSALLRPALNTGWPPKDAVISSEAIQMLQKYADEGNAPSQSKLAYLYDGGIGVNKDPQAALKWYRAAAGQGEPKALNNLGVMSLAGEVVPKNPEEALKYFSLGAEKGSSGAMDNLGEMYLRGISVSKDINEAVKWFRMAVDHGNRPAAGKLGDIYNHFQDFLYAYIWYGIGAQIGLDTAQKRDLAAQRLTVEQVKSAGLFIETWKQAIRKETAGF